MFFKQKGLPAETDLVLCTVTKILPHAVFVTLDEYEHLEGMVHISEIAPGRIRNIRDYVKEQRRIVCKVLRINEARRQIDLSLRRVGTGLRMQKMLQLKQEEKAEKLLTFIGEQLGKKDLAAMYQLFGLAALHHYERLNPFFEAVVASGKSVLEKVGLQGKDLETVYTIITEKISPPQVTLAGQFVLESFAPSGVRLIRDTLLSCKEKFGVTITYISAPKYAVSLIASDYKSGEAQLKSAAEFVLGALRGQAVVEFIRDDH